MRRDIELAVRRVDLGLDVGELEPVRLQRADLEAPVGVQALERRQIDRRVLILLLRRRRRLRRGLCRRRLAFFGRRRDRLLLRLLGVAVEIQLVDVDVEGVRGRREFREPELRGLFLPASLDPAAILPGCPAERVGPFWKCDLEAYRRSGDLERYAAKLEKRS